MAPNGNKNVFFMSVFLIDQKNSWPVGVQTGQGMDGQGRGNSNSFTSRIDVTSIAGTGESILLKLG
jgi:hypothetical protein